MTCAEIERWRPRAANRWVKEEIKRETLIERLHTLIHESDAAFALPGGAGTLTEIALMWNLMIVESLHRRPLILVGGGWQSTFDQFFRELDSYTTAPQREILQLRQRCANCCEVAGGQNRRRDWRIVTSPHHASPLQSSNHLII